MAVPEKLLAVIEIADGKMVWKFQQNLKGVVSTVELEGETAGEVRIEIPDCPAIVTKAINHEEDDLLPSQKMTTKKKKTAKKKKTTAASPTADVRIPIDTPTADDDQESIELA